ncbi:hypothetical protein LTR97_002568 [Elasticomyces elasticus]|uniref:Uncharacterized protein n=1 Tax=Elasticomyces elasticus TaxID=574655 RepID=A0AAN7WAT6_9PEZI|nr:hypothetical protein LTR97_002568 [Elasticomyces elasticus]
MSVGPVSLTQPGSRGTFGFDNAAGSLYQPAPYQSVTPHLPNSSAQTARQAFSPARQDRYDGGNAAEMASTADNTMMPARVVPAQAPTGPAPQLAQLGHTASASPQPRKSPNAASIQSPPNKYPMAAPPLPQSPANQQAASQSTSSSPTTPLSPGSQNREQQRVTLLLEINVIMLEEVNRLQMEGKGGAISPQIQAQMRDKGQNADLASEDYIQVLRRVQANLGYLMPVAQNDMQKTARGPAYITAPPHMPQLQTKYDQLKELFPDWQGYESRTSMSPRANSASGSNGTPVQI